MGRNIKKYQAGGEYREDGHEVYLKYTVKPNTPDQVAGGGARRSPAYPKITKPTLPKKEKLLYDPGKGLDQDARHLKDLYIQTDAAISLIMQDPLLSKDQRQRQIHKLEADLRWATKAVETRKEDHLAAEAHADGMRSQTAIVPESQGDLYAFNHETEKMGIIHGSQLEEMYTPKGSDEEERKYTSQTVGQLLLYADVAESVVASNYDAGILNYVKGAVGATEAEAWLAKRIKDIGETKTSHTNTSFTGTGNQGAGGGNSVTTIEKTSQNNIAFHNLVDEVYKGSAGMGATLWAMFYGTGKPYSEAQAWIAEEIAKRINQVDSNTHITTTDIKEAGGTKTIKTSGGIVLGELTGNKALNRYLMNGALDPDTSLTVSNIGSTKNKDRVMMGLKGVSVAYGDFLTTKGDTFTSYDRGLNIWELYDNANYGTSKYGKISDVTDRRIFDVFGNDITNTKLKGYDTLPERLSVKTIDYEVDIPVDLDGNMLTQDERASLAQAMKHAKELYTNDGSIAYYKKVKDYVVDNFTGGYVPEVRRFLQITAVTNVTALRDGGKDYLTLVKNGEDLSDEDVIRGMITTKEDKAYNDKYEKGQPGEDSKQSDHYLDPGMAETVIYMPMKSITHLAAVTGSIYTQTANLDIVNLMSNSNIYKSIISQGE